MEREVKEEEEEDICICMELITHTHTERRRYVSLSSAYTSVKFPWMMQLLSRLEFLPTERGKIRGMQFPHRRELQV